MKDQEIKSKNKTRTNIITICIVLILIIVVVYLNKLYIKNNNTITNTNLDESITPLESKSESENNEKNQEQEQSDNSQSSNVIPEYVDDNTIKVGLYVQDGNYKKLVKDDYYCNWDPEEILGIFYAVYTNDDLISGNSFNTTWTKYLENYTDASKYRIGYNISFEMADGKIIDQRILNPDEAYLMYPEIQFYLYDDINLVPGKRYYHVTSEEMNENTICSSVKLVGDKKTPDIISQINLTVFTYDSDDDFDPNTGRYRGNSSYTINIKRN